MISSRPSVNSLISDFVHKNNTVAIALVKSENTAISFIEKVAEHFDYSYTLDCAVGKIKDFGDYILSAIFTDDQETRRLVHQLMCARSEYNSQQLLLIYFMDKLAERKGDILVSFTHLEALNKKQQQTIAYVIKNAPENIKIIVQSAEVPQIEPSACGDVSPLFFEADMLNDVGSTAEFEKFFNGLADHQKAALVYARNMTVVNAAVIRSFVPVGDVSFVMDIINKFGHKFAYNVFDKFYAFCYETRCFLDSFAELYASNYPDMFAIDPMTRVADYMATQVEYAFEAFSIYCQTGKYSNMENLCRFMTKYSPTRLTLLSSAHFGGYLPELPPLDDAPFYSIIRAHSLIGHGKIDEAEAALVEGYKYFNLTGNELGIGLATSSFMSLHKAISVKPEFIKENVMYAMEGLRTLKLKNNPLFNWINCLGVRCRDWSDISISAYQRLLMEPQSAESPMYIYNMEGLIEEYMKQGNFRSAFEVVKSLKQYFPYYVVSYDVIFSRYYIGEVEEAQEMAREAERFADEHDFQISKVHLYALKGILFFYYGQREAGFDAIERGFEAYKKDNNASRGTFYRLLLGKYVKMIQYGDVIAARNSAYAYLLYCDKYDPEGLTYMQTSIAFANKMLGDFESANQYAMQAIQTSKLKCMSWLVSMGIATSHMLKNNDFKESSSLVGNILHSAMQYGLDMVLVDYYDEVFGSIINYAQINGIELDYTTKIEKAYEAKAINRSNGADFEINMFGDVVITSLGRTVQWKTRKSRDLFLLYIMAGEAGLDRATIIDYLWNGYLYESAINNLKTTNNIIRNTLKSCGIKFELDYINTKYKLRVVGVYNNYDELKKLLVKVKEENLSIDDYLGCINDILKIYRGDFATDMNFQEFEDERNTLKHDVRMALVTAVRTLEKEGNYLEAKRILTALMRIDKKFDYSHMQNMIDSRLGF